MSWPSVRLSEICEIRIGRTPARANRAYWGQGFRWLSIADMNQGRQLRVTKEQITETAVREAGGFRVPAGTVVLSFKLSVGKVGTTAVDMFTNEAIAALPVRDSSKVDVGYLAWALDSLDLSGGTNRAAMGATLNKPALEEIQIPRPPLDEQRRIARILDSVAALTVSRRMALELLDDLMSSVFVSMFGDPVANPRGFPVSKLGSLGVLERGVSKHRPRNAPELLGGPYPLIQTGDVARSGGLITSYSSTYSEAGLRQSRLWPAGTLCITIAANIAKTGVMSFDACFPDSVVGFTADPALTAYVQAWLRFLQPTIERSAPESAQKNINLAILRELPIPIPPPASLTAFDDKAKSTRAAKELQVTSLGRLESLSSSLQYRAFAGEL